MYQTIKLFAVLISIFSIFGCSKSIDSATQNAMSACGIALYEADITDSAVNKSTPDDGEYFFTSPDSTGENGFWNVEDPLPSHQKRAEAWSERAISASAASKLDAKYATLSLASTNLANANKGVITVKNQMKIDGNPYSNYGYYDWTFLNSYNNDLNTWSIECASIVEVLNQ